VSRYTIECTQNECISNIKEKKYYVHENYYRGPVSSQCQCFPDNLLINRQRASILKSKYSEIIARLYFDSIAYSGDYVLRKRLNLTTPKNASRIIQGCFGRHDGQMP